MVILLDNDILINLLDNILIVIRLVKVIISLLDIDLFVSLVEILQISQNQKWIPATSTGYPIKFKSLLVLYKNNVIIFTLIST